MKRRIRYGLSMIMVMLLLLGSTMMANAETHACGGLMHSSRVCTNVYKGPLHSHTDQATGATYSCRVYTYVYKCSKICGGCGYTVSLPDEVQTLHVAQ